MTYMFWLAAVAVALTSALVLHRQSAKRRRWRAAYLDAVAPLFENQITALAATGFARLSGHYQGVQFDLQAVPDTLSYRKLPALWLLVTLTERMPTGATLDVMLRPTGVESFSNFRDLAVQIDTPHGFPADCALRCDDPAGIPAADLIVSHLARLDQDQLKELVIAPKGLRIVWLAEEANRTRYLAFRDAEMGCSPLPAARLEPLLAALIALRDDLVRSKA